MVAWVKAAEVAPAAHVRAGDHLRAKETKESFPAAMAVPNSTAAAVSPYRASAVRAAPETRVGRATLMAMSVRVIFTVWLRGTGRPPQPAAGAGGGGRSVVLVEEAGCLR